MRIKEPLRLTTNYFYERISDNFSLLLWDCDRVKWRCHSLLELAIGCVVGENSLSRVELMCCINDWTGKGRGGRWEGGRENEWGEVHESKRK